MMKTIVYNIEDGRITDVLNDRVELSGVASGKNYMHSQTASGSEVNISEIKDRIVPKRIIDGSLITEKTRKELDNATTVASLRKCIQKILFGD